MLLLVPLAAVFASPGSVFAQGRVTLTPASGVPGTAISLKGTGFSTNSFVAKRSKIVLVKARGKVLARAAVRPGGSFDASARVPAAPQGQLKVETAAGQRRVVSVFQASMAPRIGDTREVATQAGLRLRGYPYQASAGTQIRLAGTRFPRNRRVRITVGRLAIQGARTSPRGTFLKWFAAPSLPPGPYRITARVGSKRLALGFVLTVDPLIAAAGDIACDPESSQFNALNGTPEGCHMRATSDVVSAASPQAVVALGDTQYEAGTPPDFQASYQPTWGRFKSITRPVIGNHEYGHQGGAGYWDYFGPLAGARPGGYYSWDIGTWHMIALNSYCRYPTVSCGVGSAQEQWLRADLAAHRNRCVLAYMHHPIFTSGGEEPEAGTEPFFDDLYQGGADLLLVAHSHNYERFAPQAPGGRLDQSRGVRQFVVGTGGRDLQSFDKVPLPNSEVRNGDTYGVLLLHLRPTSFDWRFVPEPGYSFSDAGSQACH